MARRASEEDLIHVAGDSEGLVDRLRAPLLLALSGRRCAYLVRIDSIGRVGEVLVSITGASGRRLPLLLGRDELEPGYVSRVVRDAVDRFAV